MKIDVTRLHGFALLLLLLMLGCGRDPAALGIRALQDGNLQKAETLFNQVLEQDPDDPTAVMNLAVIHLKNGQLDAAMTGFTQAANLAPQDPRPIEYIAACLMDNGRWREAGDVLAEATRRDPRSPSIITAQALVDLYTTGAPTARTRLIQVINMEPRYAPALFDLAVIERDWLKNQTGGKRYFQRYLALAKNDTHATIARAALAEKTTPPPRGIDTKPAPKEVTALKAPIAKATPVPTPVPAPVVTRNPQEAAEAFMQGLRYHQARETDKAIQEYSRAIQLDPNSARAYFNLGLLLRGKGDHAHARESFEKTVALAPHMTEARYMLALEMTDQGDTEKAINQLKIIIEKAPNYAEAHLALGMLYKKDKAALSLARKELSQYLKLDPDGAAAHEVKNWLKYQD